ncbi:amino acid adenylation domain-containing protein [Streptomyces sp. NPDC050400]|uniref:amino acid adenylation domain-containing protein n=1 Tax=Streptomyces sp. NPDC050400 TaxID=3365610 RepID=UPI00378AEF97
MDPRTDLVRSIFAEILDLPEVDPDGDFFELGGQSLLASRVLGRLRAAFGVDITAREFFSSPTPSGLTGKLDSYRTTRPPVAPHEPSPQIPLSYAQQRMWFLNQVAGGGSGYNIPVALWLSGELDHVALRHAVRDVIARQDALRTIFPAESDTPTQQVLDVPDLAAVLPVLHVEPDEAAEAVRRHAAEGFDLTADVPLRARLFVLGPQEHVLLLAFHHIAVDGWSFEPLRHDLSSAYRARLAGAAPAWPDLPVRSTDYAQWQRTLAADDADGMLAKQLGHWLTELKDLPAQIALPADRPRSAAGISYRGGRVPFHLDAELHQRLTDLGRVQQATLFMLLHAGLGALLTRLGAGTDLPIGAPVAGRTDAALDDLVGFFVNTLVLRTDTSGEPTFRELVERVRATDLAAFDAQDVPFEQVVEAVNPVRSPGLNPLFQVMLAVQTHVAPALDAPGITSRFDAVDIGVSRFELFFSVQERRSADGTPCGIDGIIEYSTDLYDQSTVEAMAEQFGLVLAQAVADPDRPVAEGELLLAAGRHRVLTDWNDSARSLPDADLVTLLEDRAARTPSAIAAVTDTDSVTYEELHARANRLARELIGRGAGQERVVAVLLDRSVDLLVALLATVKAGAVYLPVDPDYPDERLAFTIEDAAPVVVVTRREHAHRVPGALVVDAADGMTRLERHPATALTEDERAIGDPAAAAYLIYTSGSTGVPKGVVMPAAGLLNMVCWQADRDTGSSAGVVAQLASVGFDVSLEEILPALIVGGTIAIPDPEVRTDPVRLVHWMDRHRVTMVIAPTLMIDSICSAAVAEGLELPAFTDLAQAGSPLMLSDDMRALLGGPVERRLLNYYGPTETHAATMLALSGKAAAKEQATAVPIGRPVWNQRIYLLDDQLRPVPPGVIGEIFVAGEGVARGYLARPALTAERFLPDPFVGTGRRMYRTGDLARWTSDGTLLFAGRTDHQVKIRGYRVEPGEVEATLLGHPDVASAAVIAVEPAPGDIRLVAYAVGVDGTRLIPARLRRYLADLLPAFMVPASFVALDRMPVNANGKVDAAALPAPQWTAGGRAPRTPQEELLCRLVADVLKIAEVGVDDDFFELGGHSLQVARLASRVRSVLDVPLPVRVIFEQQTVAGIANAIDDLAPNRPPARVMSRPERMPLSFAQRRLWFVEQLETSVGHASAYHIPSAFSLTGELDLNALHAAFDDVLTRHESLRTAFPVDGDEPWQRVLDPGNPVLTTVDSSESELADALRSEVERPFELASAPPVRAVLFRLGPNRHVLLVILHHIATDHWSMRPLLRDLSTAYAARRAGGAPQWTPLPVQYADYTLWQQEILGTDGGAVTSEVDYWTQQLAGLPETLELPLDRPRPAVRGHQGGTVHFDVDTDLHAALARFAGAGRASLFMALQTALAGLLNRIGAGADIPIGAPIAGRNDDALDDLVGFFVNTLVLRTDTSGNPTFTELLARVRETNLAAYANQDVPFERLVEALRPTRSLSHNPLFQVTLTLQGAGEAALDLPGVAAARRQIDAQTAKFDLSFSFTERRGADGSPQGMAGLVEFATDVFDEETVVALTQRFVQVMRATVADPGARLDTADVLLPSEREALLSGAMPI